MLLLRLKLELNFITNFGAVRESLVVDTLSEELVEVEMVFYQEADVACLELKGLVPQDLRVREGVRVERS